MGSELLGLKVEATTKQEMQAGIVYFYIFVCYLCFHDQFVL